MIRHNYYKKAYLCFAMAGAAMGTAWLFLDKGVQLINEGHKQDKVDEEFVEIVNKNYE